MPDPASEAAFKRFQVETAEHAMTVLHDNGLYRHLRFQREWWQPPWLNKQTSSMYWFEIITAPGSLTFRGDGDSFVFARIEDMFDFFRGPVGRINPQYWAEKITSGRDSVRRYDSGLFERHVKEEFVEAVRERLVPPGTGLIVRQEVLDYSEYEHDARTALAEFEHEGFRFSEPWDVNFEGYHWWFLWALHGIVWGIAQYDAHHGRTPRAAEPVPAFRTPVVVEAVVAGGVL